MARLGTLLARAASSMLFRALMTVIILGVVIANVDWAVIGERIAHGQPVYGLLAVLCIAAALGLGGVRWGLLLHAVDAGISRRELYRVYSVASFATAFLPSAVGGDVARPFMISRRGPKLVRAVTTVLLERLLALGPLIGLAWLGVALERSATSGGPVAGLAVASAAILAVAGFAVWQRGTVRRLARRFVPARIMSHAGEADRAARSVLRSRRVLSIALLQSVAFQVLVTMQLVFLGKMIGVELPFGVAAVALALVTLAMLIPISIGGFGVREGSYVVVLAGAGISHTDAVLISLLSVVALFIATLPGAVELVRGGFSVAHPFETEAT